MNKKLFPTLFVSLLLFVQNAASQDSARPVNSIKYKITCSCEFKKLINGKEIVRPNASNFNIFSSEGKLLWLYDKDNKIPGSFIDKDSSLAKKRITIRNSTRKLFADKIEKTIRNLEKDSALIDFYQYMWGKKGLDEVITELSKLKNKFEKADAFPLEIYSELYKSITEALKDTIFYGSQAADEPHKFIFKQTLPFNMALIDYYNTTYANDENSKVKKLKDLDKYTLFITKQKAIIDSLINELAGIDLTDTTGADNNEVISFIKRSRQFQKNLTSDPHYINLIGILKAPWFKEWIWMREGSLKLNPFDFTTDNFLKKYPEYDVTKSALFEAYIDKRINNYIHLDTFGDIDKFQKILSLKGTGNDLYSLKEKNEKMASENNELLKKVLYTTQWLNQVEIPDAGAYYTYTKTGKIKIRSNDNRYLEEPARTHETKTLVVHNIPNGEKLVLQEKDKKIIDRSEFQQGLDSVASTLGGLAAIVSKMSPLSNLLNVAHNIPKGNNQKISKIFTLYKSKKKLGPEDILALRKENDSLNKYSLILTQLAAIFGNTTLPPAELKGVENKAAVYHSAYKTTTPAADPITRKVEVLVVGNKGDTATLANFSYSTGKNYRLQLSAGIAYTFNEDFVQTTVVETNGHLEITNSAQQYQFLAGLNVHPFGKGLFLQDNSFVLRWYKGRQRFFERLSLYLGIGITKKPIDNAYLGLAVDIFPGLKVTGGMRLYRNDFYKIQNDIILEQRIRYQNAGLFTSISIDPTTLINGVTNFLKFK